MVTAPGWSNGAAWTGAMFRRRPCPLGWGGTATGTASVVGTLLDGGSVAPSLHAGTAACRWTSVPKGRLGEVLVERLVLKGLLAEGGGWAAVTPARVGRAGIDGLFLRVDTVGNPRGLLVAEAKTYDAQLGYTSHGRQMSPTWMADWLDRTARQYRSLAEALAGEVTWATRVPAGVPSLEIPLGGGRTAVAWQDAAGRWHLQAPEGADVLKQVRRVGQYLHGAAQHVLEYRARVFRYHFEGASHALEVHHVDPSNGSMASAPDVFRGTYEELRPVHQKLLRAAFRAYFEDVFRRRGVVVPADVIEQHVDEACRNPGYARNFQTEARLDPRIGLTRANLLRAGFAAALAFLLDVALQLWRTGAADLWRSTKVGLLAGASTFVGLYVGAQATAFLHTPAGSRLLGSLPLRALTRTRAAMALGGAAGAVAGAAVFAYGGVLLGLYDLRTANRMVVAGAASAAAGVGVTTGAFAAAGAWGVAGTGTAIGTLSGAAFQSASLAWMGSAVGGGMAAGGIVLSGGVLVVGLAAAAGVNAIFAARDEAARIRAAEGHLWVAEGRMRAAAG